MTNDTHRETGQQTWTADYLAYGSNLNLNQMALRCPAAQPIGRARLDGWEFRINDRGVATVVPSITGTVFGGIWRVTTRCLRALDRYEGVSSGLYRRSSVVVVLEDGSECEAIVYVGDSSRPGAPRPGYLAGILAGAVDFDLPDHYRARLAACA